MEVLDTIQTRRSIRKFTGKPVKRKDLLKILNAARMAPSGANFQPWHFIVVKNKKIIKEMADMISNKIDELPTLLEGITSHPRRTAHFLAIQYVRSSLFFREAPITIAVLVQYFDYTYINYFSRKGLDLFEANKYLGLVEVQSTAAAIENLLLAAHALGYGACWMNIPFMAKDELKRLLGVKSPWDLMALVPIGVPDPAHWPKKPKRKKIEQIVTFL